MFAFCAQSAFIDQGALQCGFCTPGMILTAEAILNEDEQPTEDAIKKKMAIREGKKN